MGEEAVRHATAFGGTLDGQVLHVVGARHLVPFTDSTHAEEYHEWFNKWGVPYTITEERWDGPPPPRFPCEVYDWLLVNDRILAVYAGVER